MVGERTRRGGAVPRVRAPRRPRRRPFRRRARARRSSWNRRCRRRARRRCAGTRSTRQPSRVRESRPHARRRNRGGSTGAATPRRRHRAASDAASRGGDRRARSHFRRVHPTSRARRFHRRATRARLGTRARLLLCCARTRPTRHPRCRDRARTDDVADREPIHPGFRAGATPAGTRYERERVASPFRRRTRPGPAGAGPCPWRRRGDEPPWTCHRAGTRARSGCSSR